jgi:hypothetical protein
MIGDDAVMRIRPFRLLIVAAAALALVLPAAGVAGPRGTTVDRGVIQSIDASHITLRALDGSTVTLDLFPGTRVKLNGKRASLADIGPGLVAEVTADRKGRALQIRAFGTSPAAAATTTERGIVTSVTKRSISFTALDGGTRTVTIDRLTRFRLLGRPAGARVVRPGAVVAVTHAGDGPALVVNVLKRARA